MRKLRAFNLQTVQASVVERQKKFSYPLINCGKEDTHIILLSASDRSRSSTTKQNLSKDTLESGIDVGQGINVGPGKLAKKNKHRALNKHRA